MSATRLRNFTLAVPLLGASCCVCATEASDPGMMGLYGDEEFVTIATGSSKPLSKAPALATVITAEDIEATGATDLDEALEMVPGLHVARSYLLYNPIYSIRGVYSDNNPEVLMLVNGIPVTNLFHGDRNFVWGGMPVKAISRIEVIRGPGSALYGADAFSGVINIVTKQADEIDGTEAGVRVGSFGSRSAWLAHGGKLGGFDLAVTAEVGTTDGQGERVSSDLQSSLDALFGTSASLAPGPVNLGRDNLDLRVDLSRGPWRLRGGVQQRDDVENGVGAGALDPVGTFRSRRLSADLTFHDPYFTDEWDLMVQASVLDTTQEVEAVSRLFPPGAFGGAFPQGVLAGPEVSERHGRLNVSAFYSGFEGHRLRLGGGWEYGDLYEVNEYRNYTVGAGGALVPLPGGLVYQTDAPGMFLPERDRTLYYAFVQDEWTFAQDWELTLGLRYDDYSDFGDTLNPRLALVWQTDYDLTTKLLYGRAFRAPAFAELYNQNNPVVLGNAALQPETIDTWELAWDYRPATNWRGSLGLFRYRMKDIIDLVNAGAVTQYQNGGEQTGYGAELEGEWKVNSELTLRGNFAWQRSEMEAAGADAGNAPHRQLYLRADWRFAPDWNLDGQLNWVMDRARESGDARPPVDDYATIDLTLRHTGYKNHWDMALSVRNLFDEDVREPAPLGAGVANDLPLPGRSAYLELQYRF